MLDAVLVLDPYRRVVKLNPAAERALGRVPAPGRRAPRSSSCLGVEPSLVERAARRPRSCPRRWRSWPAARLRAVGDPPGRPERPDHRQGGGAARRHRAPPGPRAAASAWTSSGAGCWGGSCGRQEEERRRIAGEVHDDAIQTIAAARLMLTTFRDQLTDDRQRRLLDHLEEAVSSSLRRLRTLVFDLRPAQLDDDGLAAALREYLAETARQGGFVAELRDDLEREPPPEARVIAYRICQEALTNVRVHARAGRVEVRLEEAQGGLLVSVADDGTGFEAERVRAVPRRGHLGLTSMSERATMADGWCRVDSHPGRAPPSGSGSRPRTPARLSPASVSLSPPSTGRGIDAARGLAHGRDDQLGRHGLDRPGRGQRLLHRPVRLGDRGHADARGRRRCLPVLPPGRAGRGRGRVDAAGDAGPGHPQPLERLGRRRRRPGSPGTGWRPPAGRC